MWRLRTKGLTHKCGKELKLADMKIEFVSSNRGVGLLRDALDGCRRTLLEERQSRSEIWKGKDDGEKQKCLPEFRADPSEQLHFPTLTQR